MPGIRNSWQSTISHIFCPSTTAPPHCCRSVKTGVEDPNAGDASPRQSLLEMTYLCIPASDLPSQDLTQHFKDSIAFIHESRLKREGCLVHCLAGVSRSVTLVVAYIMTVTGLGWQDTLSAVRVARPCAGPNAGFLRQLENFENNQLADYRAWLKGKYKESPFNDMEEVQILLSQKLMANGADVAQPGLRTT